MQTIRQLFSVETIRAQMGMPPQNAGMRKPSTMQQDNTDMDDGQQQPMPNVQPTGNLQLAPYVKMLSKLGYEFKGDDEDVSGSPIGSTFQGPDGDMIIVNPDGSWQCFMQSGQKASGPDAKSLGQRLMQTTLSQSDDTNHNQALRHAGYRKFHTDSQGNNYYKHPQTGKTVTVTKDGRWNSSVGSGRGAGKLGDFLGNEQLQDQAGISQDMVRNKVMKEGMRQGNQVGNNMRPQPRGTRGRPGTRGM